MQHFFQSQSQHISLISENTDHPCYRVIQSLCGDGTAAVLVFSTQAPAADTTWNSLLVKIKPAGNKMSFSDRVL